MDNQIPEAVVDALDGLYMWRAGRPGVALLGSYVGRVLLTNHRFRFHTSSRVLRRWDLSNYLVVEGAFPICSR